ncbi:hypothetical protein DFH09DRAFT_1339920 [Mycena vulgaris]|nr:hypothetical protein DFH09DRAFT_1339920 [Mycena vulgaris]
MANRRIWPHQHVQQRQSQVSDADVSTEPLEAEALGQEMWEAKAMEREGGKTEREGGSCPLLAASECAHYWNGGTGDVLEDESLRRSGLIIRVIITRKSLISRTKRRMVIVRKRLSAPRPSVPFPDEPIGSRLRAILARRRPHSRRALDDGWLLRRVASAWVFGAAVFERAIRAGRATHAPVLVIGTGGISTSWTVYIRRSAGARPAQNIAQLATSSPARACGPFTAYAQPRCTLFRSQCRGRAPLLELRTCMRPHLQHPCRPRPIPMLTGKMEENSRAARSFVVRRESEREWMSDAHRAWEDAGGDARCRQTRSRRALGVCACRQDAHYPPARIITSPRSSVSATKAASYTINLSGSLPDLEDSQSGTSGRWNHINAEVLLLSNNRRRLWRSARHSRMETVMIAQPHVPKIYAPYCSMIIEVAVGCSTLNVPTACSNPQHFVVSRVVLARAFGEERIMVQLYRDRPLRGPCRPSSRIAHHQASPRTRPATEPRPSFHTPLDSCSPVSWVLTASPQSSPSHRHHSIQ